MDAQKTWEKVADCLKNRLGENAFASWILPLKMRPAGEGGFILEAPDKFFRDWVEENYKAAIQEAINEICQKDSPVSIEISLDRQSISPRPAARSLKNPSPESTDNTLLNSRYTFENFVVGPSNRHAHAYSLAVAESPAKAYNPLFIYGGVGLGKTHLIQAICHHIRNKSPNLKICYLPSERFTNELIEAIQHHSTGVFRQKYRNVGILVIDDIHFIAGKESTQEEFFHTFNTLYDAHKQIILSSDRPPREISNLQERLVSRFGWGLTTDIQPPDLETRVAILKKKVEREPISVPDEVIFFIAQLIKTNIRELEGALVRVIAHSLLEEEEITLELAKKALKDLLKEPKKLITVDFIQRCVVEEFGTTLQDLKSKQRNKNIVLARQVGMYLSRELTDLSLPEIGGFFGGKDHTTVLHAWNKIKEELTKNEVLKAQIEKIIQVIH